jgi:hypothetical protein
MSIDGVNVALLNMSTTMAIISVCCFMKCCTRSFASTPAGAQVAKLTNLHHKVASGLDMARPGWMLPIQ